MILTADAKIKDKLRSLFKLFDLNDADIIGRTDLLFLLENCAIAACRLRQIPVDVLYKSIQNDYLEQLLSITFKENYNHLVRQEEFIESCFIIPEIQQFLTLFMNQEESDKGENSFTSSEFTEQSSNISESAKK